MVLACWCAAGLADSHVTAKQSLLLPHAVRSLLLDVTRAGERLVAVGERGHVLISPGGSVNWKQVPVPTRATLTAVDFLDASTGLAVGHDAVILRTRDGGDSWQRVFFDPGQERPLLDVMVVDANRAVAVGAYGLYLESRDGGETWTERVLETGPVGGGGDQAELPSDDLHLNRIMRAKNGRWYMAAEAGALYRSDDAGATWQRLPSAYDGSFFGLLSPGGDRLLVFGLQGRLFHSSDAGQSWERLETSTSATLTDGLVVSDKELAIVGHAGALLVSRDGGRSFRLRPQQRAANSALAALDDGDLLLVGEGGSRLVPRATVFETGTR